MRRFCPSCGKATEEFYEGLCEDCFFRRVEIISAPAEIEAEVCPVCGRVKERSGKVWSRSSYESRAEMVEQIAKRSVKLNRPAHLSILVEKFSVGEKRVVEVPVTIRAVLDMEGKKLFTEKDLKFVIRSALCNVHSGAAARSGYYEAVIQVRGGGELVKRLTKEILEKVDIAAKKIPLSFVSQIKKVGGGVDIYIGSKNAAEKIAGDLVSARRLEMKRSFSVGGMKGGKTLYRETILLRSRE